MNCVLCHNIFARDFLLRRCLHCLLHWLRLFRLPRLPPLPRRLPFLMLILLPLASPSTIIPSLLSVVLFVFLFLILFFLFRSFVFFCIPASFNVLQNGGPLLLC